MIKSLRNVDIDQVVIVKGLKYDAEDKTWGGTKIYDPSKGIRVNVTAEFESADKLKLRGPSSESVLHSTGHESNN